MIEVSSRQRIIFWLAGAIALLGLNLRRDLNFTAKKYNWEPVEQKTLHQSVPSVGVMEAIRVAEIKSDVTETVLKKLVQEGQAVKKGELLVELSRTQTQLEYEQTRNAYLNAESDYKKVSRELEIQKKLLKNLAVSRAQVEETADSKEKAKAAKDIAVRQLDIVKEKLDGTMVRSPMDGVVLKDFTKVGDKITSGKEIITVGDVSKFIVRSKIDELDIQQVRPDQPVHIEADAYPGQIMEGRVSRIATQAERETFANVEVVIDITNSGVINLKHNLSVRVKILTGDIDDAIGVPSKSIRRKKGKKAWVVVRNKFNIVKEKVVTLGRVAGDEVEVVSGLKPGIEIGLEKPSGAPL